MASAASPSDVLSSIVASFNSAAASIISGSGSVGSVSSAASAASSVTPSAASSYNSATSPSMATTHAWPPVGALTTVYTPSDPYCATGVSRYDVLKCMPPHYDEYIFDILSHDGYGYYSPAICPSGYTSACNKPEDSNTSYGPPLLPSETAMVCCPSRYQCDPIHKLLCVSALSSPLYSTTTVFYTDPTSTATDYYSINATLAFGVQVRWQASDLSVFETPPLGPTATFHGTSTLTPPAGSGLSTGAKIGIGVGVSLVALGICLAAAVFCLFRRRRKLHKAQHGEVNDREIAAPPMANTHPTELPTSKAHRGDVTSREIAAQLIPTRHSDELLTRHPNELPTEQPNELPTRHPAELATRHPNELPTRHQDELATRHPNELPTYSDLSFPVQLSRPDLDAETEMLREEQARLQERRERLRRLERLDEEEERIRRQIAYNEAQRHRGTPAGPHELTG